MKIKTEQLDRLATLLISVYRKKELIVTKATDQEFKANIVEIIGRNFAEEEAIEEEARKMLASHALATRDMDKYKMFLLAKQKLAAKKRFILLAGYRTAAFPISPIWYWTACVKRSLLTFPAKAALSPKRSKSYTTTFRVKTRSTISSGKKS